ncbi:MAG: BatA and WFA domain-containing protein [Chitinophagaceae bacterium]|nr:BatA and WFA domain-containing protein [Chitinophagaceae bacterium]
MNFLYPLFLIAGLAVVIPILIHLFNFRRYKKVFFPDIRFLKELKEQTQKQSQLKHLLILASRILAILSLVFAFMQPFFSKDADKMNQGPKAVSIYIDNSYSMGLEQGSLSLLDIAKGKAKEIIESYGASDQIQILTNDFGYHENKFLEKQEALRALSTISVSSTSRTVQVILEKQKQLLQTEPGYQKQQIYISDFQKNSFPLQTVFEDSIKKYFLKVQAQAVNNISIDTVYFDSPSLLINEANPISIKLKNSGAEDGSTSISLRVNDQLKSVINTTIKAGSHQVEKMSLTTSVAGHQKMEFFIQDYPVTFDDTFFVSGKIASNYAVMVLNQSNANAYLSSVFKPGTQFRMDNHQIQTLNSDILKNYSLVILNGVTSMTEAQIEGLSSFLQQGGSMLVFAPQSIQTGNLNTFLSKVAGCSFANIDSSKLFVTGYNRSHELFKDLFSKTPENIDLPSVNKHFILNKGAMSSEQKLFTFSNGDAFLSAFKTGNGNLYICASSAEASSSSFPKSYWFLPLIYKMAFSTTQYGIQSLTLGKNATLNINNTKIGDKTVYHINKGVFDAIPEQRAIGSNMQINTNNAVQESGVYGIYLPESKDTTFTGLNYDRKESDLQYWTMDELSKQTKIKNASWLEDKPASGTSINELQHGLPLWKVCVILALLFLMIEILLIRFMK